ARLVADHQVRDARFAPRRLEQRGEDLDGGGLAGAVGADEAEAVALVDLEVEVRQRDQRAVALGEVDGLDYCGHVAASTFSGAVAIAIFLLPGSTGWAEEPGPGCF